MITEHKNCSRCSSTCVTGVEYGYPNRERHDGVSEWQCQECNYREGRWTGKEIHDGELESRYGERGVVKERLN